VVGKLREAVRAGALPDQPTPELLDAAVAAGVVTPEERSLVIEAEAARGDAIQVDDYSPAALQRAVELMPQLQPARPEPPASARH
jgi:acyl-CoA dehydrogenase